MVQIERRVDRELRDLIGIYSFSRMLCRNSLFDVSLHHDYMHHRLPFICFVLLLLLLEIKAADGNNGIGLVNLHCGMINGGLGREETCDQAGEKSGRKKCDHSLSPNVCVVSASLK